MIIIKPKLMDEIENCTQALSGLPLDSLKRAALEEEYQGLRRFVFSGWSEPVQEIVLFFCDLGGQYRFSSGKRIYSWSWSEELGAPNFWPHCRGTCLNSRPLSYLAWQKVTKESRIPDLSRQRCHWACFCLRLSTNWVPLSTLLELSVTLQGILPLLLLLATLLQPLLPLLSSWADPVGAPLHLQPSHTHPFTALSKPDV